MMKKRIVLSICILVILCTQTLSAQKPHSDLYNEIGVDAGPVSVVGGVVYGTIGFWTAVGGGLSHKPVEMNLYGCYNVHYYYQVTHWCQVGMKTVVEGSKLTYYTDTTKRVIDHVSQDVLLSFMPSVRFTYLNRPWVRLYSSVDVGLGFFLSSTGGSDGESGNKALFAFNITPIGVSVGKKFYGLFELNAGYDSVVKVGIGARF